MKLEALIKIASKAYPEDLIFQAFKTKKPVGDGLAEFIYRELLDTFDSSQTSLEQLQEAEIVLDRAARELNDVSLALSTAHRKAYEDQEVKKFIKHREANKKVFLEDIRTVHAKRKKAK